MSKLWLFRDKLTTGNTYTIPHVMPALLSFDEQVQLAAFHSKVSTTTSNMLEVSRIFFCFCPDGDGIIPLIGQGGLSSQMLLPYVAEINLSCHEGTITEVISSELAVYRLNDRRVLVASLLACRADLPLMAPGTHVRISRCHSVRVEDGSVHLVPCCASRIEVSTGDSIQAFYRPHTLRWLGSLHGTYPMVKWLLRTLQKLRTQFVPQYLSHSDLVSYDTDADGERSHSLLFTLLRKWGSLQSSQPARHPILEFFHQIHDCGAISTDEGTDQLGLPLLELGALPEMAQQRAHWVTVAPTWHIAVVPLKEIGVQASTRVVGCLGLSSEGTLHLCDATGTLRLHTLMPAPRLPLGQVVLVGRESRLLFEQVAPLWDTAQRFTHVYLEANEVTPVFPCKGCPHLPSDVPSETGRQSVQLVSRSMAQTTCGKHSFQAQVRLRPGGPVRRILFGGLHWMPLLQRGEVYDVGVQGSSAMLSALDNTEVSVSSDQETIQAFAQSRLPAQDGAAVVRAIVTEKFYQEARRKQSGANTDGLCGLSPCLVVQLVPELNSLTVYFNCMTAAVALVGVGPGTLVQLEGMSMNQSSRSNQYISTTADSSFTVLSQGEAKHVCKRRLGGKWPFPGGPCNGLAYAAPSSWHCCIVDKIEVVLSPMCDRCGRRKACTASCLLLGSVPRATATARQVAQFV
ncbi:unnamed protein product [Ixodes hexagonus]